MWLHAGVEKNHHVTTKERTHIDNDRRSARLREEEKQLPVSQGLDARPTLFTKIPEREGRPDVRLDDRGATMVFKIQHGSKRTDHLVTGPCQISIDPSTPITWPVT